MSDYGKPIPGFSGYTVTVDGTVYSHKRHHGQGTRPKKQWSDPEGRKTVTLCRDRKVHTSRVHRLVLEAHVGPANGLWALHRNGDCGDNRLENLYWGTPRENVADALRHGTFPTGRNHWTTRQRSLRGRELPHTKLSSADVLEIRERKAGGESATPIAAAKGVSVSAVYAICSGRNWRHV
ncbi:MAG: HNH endonuclease [Sandaracinaceae bacterium]|nr:HNH endonuclease [Sandaracinaceae bacterium]